MNTVDFYYNPVKTYCGSNSLERLSEIIKSLGQRNPNILFLTRGNDFNDSREEKIILDQLKAYEVLKYTFTLSNPDVKDLFQVLTETKAFDYDIVLAVGGGSVLDVAKSICALKGMNIQNVDALRSIIENRNYAQNEHKGQWIGIPTTSGTGSEVTCWATIWDSDKQLKHSIEDQSIYAYAAVIDPKLTIHLPIGITISSALDAIAHATEAYWSIHTNSISRLYAVSAIKQIVNSIFHIIDEPNNEIYRANIALGSLHAGLAFSNTKTTACHAISYPITLLHGVDHGIAVSMTLAKLLACNETQLVDKEALFAAFGANNIQEVEDLIDRIYEKAGISNRLRDYGIQKQDLDHLVTSTFSNGRLNNNPVELTETMIKDILESVY